MNHFLLELDGVTVASFSECSGLTSEAEPVEYREGADDHRVRKLSGLRIDSNLTLKRGVTDSTELWQWRQAALDGRIDRRSGSLVLLDEARQPVLRWNFEGAWPVKWEGLPSNASGQEFAIESMELVVERFEPGG